MARAWRFLSSLQLAIVLLILIIILSIIGTLIPQEQAPDFYRQYLPRLAGLVSFLQFDHLYRSPLFLSLVFLFLLNLFFCSVKQLPARFKRLKARADEKWDYGASQLDKKASLKLGEWLENNPLQLVSLFRQHGYRVRLEQQAEQKSLLARKGLLGLFGPELVHLGLIIIIAGGLASAIFSQRLTLALVEGQSEQVAGHSFSLRLDRFTTEFYPDGSVKDWKSLVAVIKNGQVCRQQVIEVNHPLKYDRWHIFQVSYGQDWDRALVELEVNLGSSPARTIQVETGESAPIQNGLQLRLISFLPDFQLDASGQAFSRSPQPANPAALLEITEGGRAVFSGWVFYRYPELKHYRRQSRNDLDVRLKNFEAPPFSVLEVSSDPGTGLVWLGSALLVLGLLAAFYFPYREVRLVHRAGQPPTFLVYARKNQEAFWQEIKNLLGLKNKKE
ncbi:MAG: cytochrome c biogenesis protein ResB [Candidatus Aminicenantes bacterium]|nr:cytochrome c biogenesis protein ResB [Candidatus Aminicenantes bacterium]